MMPYTDAAMKEILRLCVIAPVAARTALKTFEAGGYTIPKVGCPLINVYSWLC